MFVILFQLACLQHCFLLMTFYFSLPELGFFYLWKGYFTFGLWFLGAFILLELLSFVSIFCCRDRSVCLFFCCGGHGRDDFESFGGKSLEHSLLPSSIYLYHHISQHNPLWYQKSSFNHVVIAVPQQMMITPFYLLIVIYNQNRPLFVIPYYLYILYLFFLSIWFVFHVVWGSCLVLNPICFPYLTLFSLLQTHITH